VTDFLVNAGAGSEDILFDNNEFRLENDYIDFESSPSSSDSQSVANSPYLEMDVKMEDAPDNNWPGPYNNSPAPIIRSHSPTRVLATQSEVNVVVKVPSDDGNSGSEKSAKKRRREEDDDVSDAVSDEIAAVYLKRDQLLTISSAEHEAFVQRLANTRDLTDAELKEVKRQRRLIKNREYAQTSRQKKKVTMGHVKEQVGSLESENDDLKMELAKLRARCSELELENASLRVKLSRDTSSEDNSYDAVVEMEQKPKSYGRSMFSFRPAMAASSILFVFLFAVGLLFNSPMFSSIMSSTLPGSRGMAPQHTGRALLSVDTSMMDYDPMVIDGSSSDPVAIIANVTEEVVNACLNMGDQC